MDKLGDKKNGELDAKQEQPKHTAFVLNNKDPNSEHVKAYWEQMSIPLAISKPLESDELVEFLKELQENTASQALVANQDLFRYEENKKITAEKLRQLYKTTILNVVNNILQEPSYEEEKAKVYNLILNLIQNTSPLQTEGRLEKVSQTLLDNKKNISRALSEIKQYYLTSFRDDIQLAIKNFDNDKEDQLNKCLDIFKKWLPIKFLQKTSVHHSSTHDVQETRNIASIVKITQRISKKSSNIQTSLEAVMQIALDSSDFSKFQSNLNIYAYVLIASQPNSYAEIVQDFDYMTDLRIVIPETIMSIHKNRLAPPLLYHNEEPWEAVCEYSKENKTYTALNTGLEILRKSMKNIVEILAAKKGDTINYIDLGTGTGDKTGEICSLLNTQGYFVDLKAVDSSYKILRSSLSSIASNILQNEVLNQNINHIQQDHPWFDLIKLIHETNARFSTNAQYWVGKVNHIIKNAIKENWETDWLKDWLSAWLDRENLILEDDFADIVKRIINAKGNFITANFKEIGEKEIPVKYPPDLLKHVITRMLSIHKGSEKGRQFIEKLDNEIDLPLKYAPFADKFTELPENFVDSKNLDEPTLITDLGCRICNTHPTEDTLALYKKLLPTPHVPDDLKHKSIEILKDEQRIKTPYLLVGFQTSHTQEGDAGFAEEKRNIEAGYNQPVFLDFVTAPLKRPGVIDYNNGNLNSVGNIHTTYENDPAYPDWYRIAHKFIFTKDTEITVQGLNQIVLQKKQGDSILLHISYKPKVSQLRDLFNANGFQVVAEYFDNDEKPGYAKFLIRKMTEYELTKFAEENPNLKPAPEKNNVPTFSFIGHDGKKQSIPYTLNKK